jgi:hypothetical protein
MALNDGYGVLVGTVNSFVRDTPDNQGRYLHENVFVNAPAGRYHCAIDVDTHANTIRVEWRVYMLTLQDLGPVGAMAPGYHALASNPTSGAVDYVRSPFIRNRVGCLFAVVTFLERLGIRFFRRFTEADTWQRGSGLDAMTVLEPLLTTTRDNNLKIYVFGEPFRTGLGMHNIHQNQGDPLNSPWSPENGIWQDGCTVMQQSATDYALFMNKFSSQSYNTDNLGHPA